MRARIRTVIRASCSDAGGQADWGRPGLHEKSLPVWPRFHRLPRKRRSWRQDSSSSIEPQVPMHGRHSGHRPLASAVGNSTPITVTFSALSLGPGRPGANSRFFCKSRARHGRLHRFLSTVVLQQQFVSHRTPPPLEGLSVRSGSLRVRRDDLTGPESSKVAPDQSQPHAFTWRARLDHSRRPRWTSRNTPPRHRGSLSACLRLPTMCYGAKLTGRDCRVCCRVCSRVVAPGQRRSHQ